MQVFIKYQSARNYFKARQEKIVRMLCQHSLGRIMATLVMKKSVTNASVKRIHDNVRWLSDHRTSKIQYLIELVTTEADYIALSTALCKVIGIFNLLEELKGDGFNVHTNTTKVTCHIFKDKKT